MSKAVLACGEDAHINGHTGGREQGSWCIQGGGLSEHATHCSLLTRDCYFPDSTGAPEYCPQKLTGVALGESPHDVHPAVG